MDYFLFKAMGKVIYDIERLVATIDKRKEKGRVIGGTGGCFDLTHRGHLYLAHELKTAVGRQGITVFNIVNDTRTQILKGPWRPYFASTDRAVLVAAWADVSYVTVHPSIEHPTSDLMSRIRPDIYIQTKGKLTEEDKERFRSYGTKIIEVEKRPEYGSTTEIEENIMKQMLLKRSVEKQFKELSKEQFKAMILSLKDFHQYYKDMNFLISVNNYYKFGCTERELAELISGGLEAGLRGDEPL